MEDWNHPATGIVLLVGAVVFVAAVLWSYRLPSRMCDTRGCRRRAKWTDGGKRACDLHVGEGWRRLP